MWLKTIQLKNIKSFAASGEVQLSKGINLLVGRNNAGKSVLLRSAYLLQGPEGNMNLHGDFFRDNVRRQAESAEVRLLLSDPEKRHLRCLDPKFDLRGWPAEFVFSQVSGRHSVGMRKNNPPTEIGPCNPPICAQREPDNFIYPFFSRRKPAGFEPGINLKNETIVEEVYSHLPAKIDRLSSPRHPGFKPFEQSCSDCLQLTISTATHDTGKAVGLIVGDGTLLSIEHMGEGTPSILALLSHLCVAKGKLFLIEEPENDIHPKALKALLELMIDKSQDNQFLISTHSHIVLKMLGGAPGAHVFSVQMSLGPGDQIPTSTCTLLDGNPESRVRLLEDLGYAPSDLYLYDAYLVLEESTAERVLRDFVVPSMFPKLQGKLRIVAAGGISKVEPYFEDFYRLFVFLHLTPQYHSRAWVAVDAGAEGGVIVTRLQDRFKTWPRAHFRCFAEAQFESYYPAVFKDEADRVLTIADKQDRQRQKGKLAEAVAAWCREHPDEAKRWFRGHAADVLALLADIEAALAAPTDAERPVSAVTSHQPPALSTQPA